MYNHITHAHYIYIKNYIILYYTIYCIIVYYIIVYYIKLSYVKLDYMIDIIHPPPPFHPHVLWVSVSAEGVQVNAQRQFLAALEASLDIAALGAGLPRFQGSKHILYTYCICICIYICIYVFMYVRTYVCFFQVCTYMHI